jgi:hypothetical protein
MRSVLSVAIFATWVLGFVVFVNKVRPIPIIVAPSVSEQVDVQ